jgi:starch synthase
MENKKKNKELLQKEFGLEVNPDKPIIAFCSRINALKGFDLVKGCIERLVNELDIQVAGVGSGDKEYVDFFTYLNNKYPKNVHVSLGFSLEIGKKIYSGADIYIMPSLTEPCGLSQLVASRYGVVPIVRETGGLKDTITDFGCLGGGNGYTFTNPVVNDLEYSIRRAVEDYRDTKGWAEKVKTVMSLDFSWKKTAKQYLEAYNNV